MASGGRLRAAVPSEFRGTRAPFAGDPRYVCLRPSYPMMRVELIGHFKPCMTDIYIYIDARMADYIYPHAPVAITNCS